MTGMKMVLLGVLPDFDVEGQPDNHGQQTEHDILQATWQTV